MFGHTYTLSAMSIIPENQAVLYFNDEVDHRIERSSMALRTIRLEEEAVVKETSSAIGSIPAAAAVAPTVTSAVTLVRRSLESVDSEVKLAKSTSCESSTDALIKRTTSSSSGSEEYLSSWEPLAGYNDELVYALVFEASSAKIESYVKDWRRELRRYLRMTLGMGLKVSATSETSSSSSTSLVLPCSKSSEEDRNIVKRSTTS